MPTLAQKNKDLKKKSKVYTVKEQKYLAYLIKRMVSSRDELEAPREWWDGMNHRQYTDEIERAFNATIKPRKNSNDWRSKTRKQTTHKKIMSIVAGVMEQNLQPRVSAYDPNDIPLQELGEALTSAVKRTNEIELDEEKRFSFLIELLKHGTIFVEEVYEVQDRQIKQLKPVNWAFGETLDDITWDQKTIKYKRDAEKNLLKANTVHLGDIRIMEMDKQPYIFTRKVINYDEARQKYGAYKKWKHVAPGGNRLDSYASLDYLPDFRLGSVKDDQVEVIRYQSLMDDEYMIILNGIMMLKPGFPMPWKHKRYNIRKRILFPISAHVAYGHGLVHKLKHDRETLDALVRLAIDKGRQSLAPPLATMSKRILSAELFKPQKVTYNLNPEMTKPLIQNPGVTSSEFGLIQYFENSIDETSISKTATGGSESGGVITATQAIQQQKAALKVLGLVIFSYEWLMIDLSWMRVQNILENYSNSIGETVDSQTNEIAQKYRVLTTEGADLPEGSGLRIVHFAPRSKHPTPENIFKQEAEEKRKGRNTQLMFVDGDYIRNLNLRFKVTMEPEVKRDTDELRKVMFKEFIEGAMAWFGPLTDLNYLSRRYAEIWGEQADKVFPQDKQDFEKQAEQLSDQVPTRKPQGTQGKQLKEGLQPSLNELTKGPTNPSNSRVS